MQAEKVSSSSHKLAVQHFNGGQVTEITLADAISYPDRDVVVDIDVKEPESLNASFLTSELNGSCYTTASVVRPLIRHR